MARLSDSVYNLCRSQNTVSSELAKNPSLHPGNVVKSLYGADDRICETDRSQDPATHDELERAYACGKWGDTRPSELFLRVRGLQPLDAHYRV